MAPLTFADTHNIVVFLSKSDASAGFDQIVDFLNGQVIQYALMVNPTIYVSCIKKFWASATIKKVNDVVKFAKRTTWNEFSCLMVSAVICLATEKEDEEEEAPNAPTPPSPTTEPSPPPQEPIPTPPQAQPAPPSSPPQEQPTTTSESSMTLLNTLMETCATLSQKVKEYQEKDKIGSKPDKNRKRGEAGKSQKQLQLVEEEILKKMQKEGSEMQIIQALFEKFQV
nr:hypothetical protein [Tanacetum cinerariifolium]